MKIGRFNLDIESLKQKTILSNEKFNERLEQIKQGGFVKREAEGYLLGEYLVYAPTYSQKYKVYDWTKMRFFGSYKTEQEGIEAEKSIDRQFACSK